MTQFMTDPSYHANKHPNQDLRRLDKHYDFKTVHKVFFLGFDLVTYFLIHHNSVSNLSNSHTVKPVLNSHAREEVIVVSYSRWLLNTGRFELNIR